MSIQNVISYFSYLIYITKVSMFIESRIVHIIS